MTILKCKMCGGSLAYTEGSTVCECEYCGSMQTVLTPDSEKKTNLFNRANRLRMNSEFDKAAALYEQLAAEFPEESEAYWGLCLCNYGIEYVDDPATGRKMPTCHRTLTASVMEDANFEQACDYADSVARKVYREEAKAIDRIQKEILSIAASEAPYDVFICYKETAEDGGRTEDSVLAQDLYDALTAKGLKVFFSRITLEDKLGVQYEPYIYAALSSAKVMLAVGTAFEYYDAVWVKNEWSRFLAMMKEDRSKTLIPCFKNLDAYDMPKEFKGLQAQDMSKLGWLQDVTRGVLKLCGKDMVQPVQTAQPTVIREAVQADRPAVNLMKRVNLFLEDGNFDQAAEYIDKVLDADAEYAPAYVAKVLLRHQLKKEQDLLTLKEPIDEDPDWQKAMRFADARQKETYDSYVRGIAKESKYISAVAEADKRKFCSAVVSFSALNDYKDSKIYLRKCIDEYRVQLIDREVAIGKDASAAKEKADRAQDAFDQLQGAIKIEENRRMAEERLEKVRLEEIRLTSNALNQLHGLFNGGKKRELEGKIDAMKSELNGITRRKQECEQSISEMKAKANAVESELNEAKNALSRIEVEIKEREQLNWPDEAVVTAAAKHETTVVPFMKVGGYATFGSYPQTKAGNDATAIEWLVLDYDAQCNKVLLISRYGLDCQPYHSGNCSFLAWGWCKLHRWLNHTFLNKAFNKAEQWAILLTDMDNSKGQNYGKWKTNSANTQDKIFLLSYAEANKYFNVQYYSASGSDKNIKSRVKPTTYAIAKGATAYKLEDGSIVGKWWLRSPGPSESDAAIVDINGSLYHEEVFCDRLLVRPAFWLDLSKI